MTSILRPHGIIISFYLCLLSFSFMFLSAYILYFPVSIRFSSFLSYSIIIQISYVLISVSTSLSYSNNIYFYIAICPQGIIISFYLCLLSFTFTFLSAYILYFSVFNHISSFLSYSIIIQLSHISISASTSLPYSYDIYFYIAMCFPLKCIFRLSIYSSLFVYIVTSWHCSICMLSFSYLFLSILICSLSHHPLIFQLEYISLMFQLPIKTIFDINISIIS